MRGPNAARIEEDDAYRVALFGTDPDRPGGCGGKVSAAVYGDDVAYVKVESERAEAEAEAHRVASESDAIRRLDARWSECMRRSGYDIASPSEALGRFVNGKVDRDEIDARAADLNCQASVSYRREYSLAFNAALSDWAARHQPSVVGAAASKAAYLDYLRRLRSGGG